MHRLADEMSGRAPSRRCSQTRRYGSSRRGAMLYAMVLANCFLVGLLGLSALTLVRVERRATARRQDLIAAQLLATSGTELAVRQVTQNANWRTANTHNVASTPVALGSGTTSWTLQDAVDADLANDPTHGVNIVGTGRSGDATWVEQRQFSFRTVSPLDFALHAGGLLRVSTDDQLTCVTGGISTNGTLDIDGLYIGAGECLSRTGDGGATGFITERAADKRLPAASVFASYAALATTLPYSGDIVQDVLSPAVNTYAGGLNTNGIYFINTSGNEITIRGSRILGTLVIQGHCRIDDAAWLQANAATYPTLIVSGNLRVTTDSQTASLSEATYNTNFNPAGAAYLGGQDSDKSDSYPNEVRGLIHIRGNLTLEKTARINGAILCEGQATVAGDDVELVYDATIRSAPPSGYDLPSYVLQPHDQRGRRIAAP